LSRRPFATSRYDAASPLIFFTRYHARQQP
jgi:hypothetical protein